MLNVLIARPEDVRGDYYLKCATTSVKKGEVVLLSGAWSHTGGPTGKVGWPGYAKIGDKVAYALKTDSVTATGLYGQNPALQFGIVDKNETQIEDSDLTLDALVSGEGVKVYVGGVFETDQYDATMTWTSLTPGVQLLFFSDAGVLTTGMVVTPADTGDNPGTVAVARFLGIKSTFDSNYAARAMVRFELLPAPYALISWDA